MLNVLRNTWALFFGFALISIAHGLQGTLVGVRSVLEGFSYASTGFVIATNNQTGGNGGKYIYYAHS